MKLTSFFKLAMGNVKNNRKIYLPYMISSAAIIAVCYIISALAHDKVISATYGGDSVQMVLSFGIAVMAIFSAVFLFYTSSFIIKHRKKEFGLFNILGMGKRHIATVVAIESAVTSAASIVIGLVFGILLSKLSQLLMLNMVAGATDYGFTVDLSALVTVFLTFAVIFFLIFLNSLRHIHLSNPIELLKSSSKGEKIPRANYVTAILGIISLGIGYWMSLSIKEPVSAINFFFIAVILVIAGTYLLMISGSVALLKTLKRNKNYYYRTNHFISTSSMIFRMKRNGAGLASICILSTMTLIMISSTACLYIGINDALDARYPRSIMVSSSCSEKAESDKIENIIDKTLKSENIKRIDSINYRYLSFAGYKVDNDFVMDRSKLKGVSASINQTATSGVYSLCFIPLDDYNKMSNSHETLNKNEVLIFPYRNDYSYDSISFDGKIKFKVKGHIENVFLSADSVADVCSSIYIIIPDNDCMKQLYDLNKTVYKETASSMSYYSVFNLDADSDKQFEFYKTLCKEFNANGVRCLVNSKADGYKMYSGLSSGLLFLGLLLGITFIVAAVLIMYYKQISEGYEDEERFSILRKVGVTDREIKKSINSQVLTVFFLPLILAGCHVIFAFPILCKLLSLLALNNTRLFAITSLVCFAIFALFYIAVYKLTSGLYYKVVTPRNS